MEGEIMATYYVSIAGNDASAGTQAAPWRHHPNDANATGTSAGTTLNAGDTVYLRRGDTFYDSYINNTDAGSAGSLVHTTSISSFYKTASTDVLPVLSGAYDPATLTWAQDGANADYYVTGTDPIASHPASVSYNGALLKLVDTQELVQATANSLWYNTSTKTVYVNVGEDPSTGVCEVAKRNNIILAAAAYQKYSYLILQMSRSATSGLIYSSAANNVFDHLEVRNYRKIGITVANVATNTVSNNTLHASFTNTTAEGGAIYISGASSTGNTISGNTIYNHPGYGILLSTDGGSSTISGNTIYDCYQAGIRIESSSNTITGNTVHDIWNQHYYGDSGDGIGILIASIGTADANIITKNYVYDCYAGIQISTATGNGGNKVYYNLVLNSMVNGIDVGKDPGVDDIVVENNTVYHNPSASNNPTYIGHGIDAQIAAKAVKIANNTVYVAVADSDCHGIYVDSNVAGFVSAKMNNNLVYGAASSVLTRLYTGGGYVNYTSADLAAYKTAVAADAKIFGVDGTGDGETNTLFADPLFMSSTDYSLRPGSPAINAGTDVSLTTDFLGKPIRGIPDIGAYEFQFYYGIYKRRMRLLKR
jgi:parallel beta-helix repeat protein